MLGRRIAYLHGIWILAQLTACSGISGSFQAGHNKKASVDLPSAQPEIDDERPSEDGEGIPGYLVDPEFVRFTESNGKLQIEARNGAFVVKSGSPEQLGINIIAFDPNNDALKAKTSNSVKIVGEQVAYRSPRADGSFSLTIRDPGRSIVLQIGESTNVAHARIQSGRRYNSVVRYQGEMTARVFQPDEALQLIPGDRQADLDISDDDSGRDILLPNSSEDPSNKYLSMLECNASGYYWNAASASCITSRSLAYIEDCKGTSKKKIEDLLDDADLEDEKEFVKDLDKTFEIHQCSYVDPEKTTIEVEFSDGMTIEHVRFPTSITTD